MRSSSSTVSTAGFWRTRGVVLRPDLVARSGEAHDTFAVHTPVPIDVAARQDERELRDDARSGFRAGTCRYAHGATRSSHSQTIVTSSMSTSLDAALSAPIEILDGHPSWKW